MVTGKATASSNSDCTESLALFSKIAGGRQILLCLQTWLIAIFVYSRIEKNVSKNLG